jgi:ABC-2 type transport system ATP-binding protein
LDEVEKVCSHVIILKKGTSLYCGPVSGITSNLGYFVLKSKELDALKKALEEFNQFSQIIIESDKIIAHLKVDIDGSELNKLLFEHDIFVSHISKEKQTLEDQFLELVKQN